MPGQRPNFFYHMHPPTIPAREARFWYTFGLGGISALLFIALVVTGVLEMFVYIPTPNAAPDSVREITYQAPYGWLIRNMHFWAGQLMVGSVVLHMARVVFSGGYKGRRINWLIGVALLALTILLDFTGYVLRWDQDTGWALLVGTNLLKEIPAIGPALYKLVVGGREIGGPTLLRFYTWHVFGLAVVTFVFIVWHSFRVRRDGGISNRSAQPRVRRANLVRTEVTGGLLVLAALVALSIIADAPLGPPADTAALIAEPNAPWFFRWVQELLRITPPLVAGILTPAGILLILGALPYTLDRSDVAAAQWFNRPGRAAQIVFLIILIGVVALTLRGATR